MGRRRKISAVDLFCGAGGLTHGFLLEGLPVNAGIDLDPACRFPYEENNKAIFIEDDVGTMSADTVANLFPTTGLRILAGCAPCQPFSTYTRRYETRADHQWGLLNKFSDLVEEITPDIVTMENVPSVSKYAVFNKFVTRLEKLHYHAWFAVVDCGSYGVAQTRKRMVLLASRLGPIQLIGPTHSRAPTVRQTIGRLRRIEAGARSPRDRLHVAPSLSDKNLKRIRASKPGGTWRDWPKSLVADCHKGSTGMTYPSVYGRMEWDSPAPTMTTQCFGYGNGRFGHPDQDRAISLREAAILQGFPKNYSFIHPKQAVIFKTIGRLIGNAVPVDLGRAIARSILLHSREVKTTLRKRTKKASSALGKPSMAAPNTGYG